MLSRLRLLSFVTAEKETCKDDFTCPDGYLNLGDKECSGKCDRRECCEKGKKTSWHAPFPYFSWI